MGVVRGSALSPVGWTVRLLESLCFERHAVFPEEMYFIFYVFTWYRETALIDSRPVGTTGIQVFTAQRRGYVVSSGWARSLLIDPRYYAGIYKYV
jgi:hypothetical protein